MRWTIPVAFAAGSSMLGTCLAPATASMMAQSDLMARHASVGLEVGSNAWLSDLILDRLTIPLGLADQPYGWPFDTAVVKSM